MLPRTPRALSTLLLLPWNALQLAFTLVVTVAGVPVALLLSLLGGHRPALVMARRYWVPLLLGGAGARLQVSGLERLDRSRPYLVVANHQSWIDVPVLFGALPEPLRFVAKSELARVPFLGDYMRATGMVLVDRATRRGGKRSVDATAELLVAGAWVVSFPEGTRSRDGRMRPFKSGGFQAAIEAGAAVVPVAIEGAGAVLPPDGFRVRPGRIEVRIGAPIEPGSLGVATRAELARAAERSVAMLLGEPAPSEHEDLVGEAEIEDVELYSHP